MAVLALLLLVACGGAGDGQCPEPQGEPVRSLNDIQEPGDYRIGRYQVTVPEGSTLSYGHVTWAESSEDGDVSGRELTATFSPSGLGVVYWERSEGGDTSTGIWIERRGQRQGFAPTDCDCPGAELEAEEKALITIWCFWNTYGVR